MTTVTRWTAADTGTILNASRTSDELNADVILLACYAGWDSHGGARTDAEALYDQEPSAGGTYSADDLDLAESLSEGATEALAWLNEHVAPEGHYFTFDDGLMLYEDGDDD